MRRLIRNIMKTSNKIGHPYFFLTVKCNPNWPEIRRARVGGKIPQRGLDHAVKVFMMRVQAMTLYIIDERMVDNVSVHISVAEFQMRCLPHTYRILFLDLVSKQVLKRSENVVELLCTEIASV